MPRNAPAAITIRDVSTIAIGSLPLPSLELKRDELPHGDRTFVFVATLLVLVAFAVHYLVELALAQHRTMHARKDGMSLAIVFSSTAQHSSRQAPHEHDCVADSAIRQPGAVRHEHAPVAFPILFARALSLSSISPEPSARWRSMIVSKRPEQLHATDDHEPHEPSGWHRRLRLARTVGVRR